MIVDAPRKHLTIKEVAGSSDDKDLLFSQFLDDFYHERDSKKSRLISEEPPETGDPVFDAKLAATAESLANDYKLLIPSWVNKQRFFISSPVWATPRVCMRDEAAREYFICTTPPEFAKRNLYFGDNLLKRI